MWNTWIPCPEQKDLKMYYKSDIYSMAVTIIEVGMEIYGMKVIILKNVEEVLRGIRNIEKNNRY